MSLAILPAAGEVDVFRLFCLLLKILNKAHQGGHQIETNVEAAASKMSLADELLADLDEVGGEVEDEEDVQVSSLS